MKSNMKSGLATRRHPRICAFALMALVAAAIMLCAANALAAPESSSTKTATSSSSQAASSAKESSSTAKDSSSQSASSSSATSSSADGSSSSAGQMDSQSTVPEQNPYAGESDGFPLGYDLLLAGDNISASASEVFANLFAAGRLVNVNQTTIGTDGFIAGETVNIENVKANNGIYAAGNSVTISDTSGRELFAAGNNLNISADMQNARIYGKTVFLKGTYEGDVEVDANTVIVDPYIVVKGELKIIAESEPSIASTASLGSYQFTPANSASFLASDSTAEIGSEAWLQSLLAILLTLLVSLVFLLLVLPNRTVNATGAIVRNRPIATIISGLLAIIVIPAAILGLFISQIGWPVAGFLFALLLAATLISVPYGALALGRAFLRRINKWLSTLLFMIIFALLLSLPIVEFVLIVLCVIIAWGSAIQGWWVWRRGIELEDEDGDDPKAGGFVVPRGDHSQPIQPVVPEKGFANQPANGYHRAPGTIAPPSQTGNAGQGWNFPADRR